MALRFPYLVRHSSRPVIPLGGILFRTYPQFAVVLATVHKTAIYDGLLDRGADDTILPVDLASVLGVDLTQAPEGEARGFAGTTQRCRYASVRLRITDTHESCVWDALVAFVSVPMKRLLLGRTGFLQFYDAKLLGLAEELQLEPNTSFPGQHVVH